MERVFVNVRFLSDHFRRLQLSRLSLEYEHISVDWHHLRPLHFLVYTPQNICTNMTFQTYDVTSTLHVAYQYLRNRQKLGMVRYLKVEVTFWKEIFE